jgi:nucleoside-diphosphate-sugar epimerase
VARALIVGCGCRGRELASALLAEGHAVRGTTRDAARIAAIEATGAEAVVADPGRLATLASRIEGVSILCWLMGTATGDPKTVAAVHGPRLESMLAAIVDTPVRGVVYEAAGTAPPAALAQGADLVRTAADTFRMPVGLIETHPADHGAWLGDARASAARVIAG